MRTTLLPSRASAPDHCAECDGPRDLDGPLCTECVDVPLIQRLEWRYQNGEGISSLHDGDRWSVSREFHPLRWALAVHVNIDGPVIGVAVGPWSFWIARDQ